MTPEYCTRCGGAKAETPDYSRYSRFEEHRKSDCISSLALRLAQLEENMNVERPDHYSMWVSVQPKKGDDEVH